ncbi:MAG TPA: adenine methyltransferase [Candidatus Scalindua sp.]|nr:adenine methyltransferase [Candidatus Scalindua sp.]
MIPFPDKKYQIIYADPPWKYRCWYKSETVKRNAADHYDVTETNILKQYAVPSTKDSVCLMWVTYPCLKEGIELLEAWGFTYKTVAFTWAKKNKKADTFFFGLGNYTRANAETVLLGTKGKGLKRQLKNVRQLCTARIREHSQKPDEIRERIVQLFGDLPRIELFARQKTPGWDVWGNEV